jgi:hypothetical protein
MQQRVNSNIATGRVLGDDVKVVFRVWILVFGLVGAQMSWVLRPFLGHPGTEFALLRARESNFFEAVLSALSHLFRLMRTQVRNGMATLPTSPRHALLSTADAVLRGSDAGDAATAHNGEGSAIGTGMDNKTVTLLWCIIIFGMAYVRRWALRGVRTRPPILYSSLKCRVLLVNGRHQLAQRFVLYTVSGYAMTFLKSARLARTRPRSPQCWLPRAFTLLWYASCSDYRLAILLTG